MPNDPTPKRPPSSPLARLRRGEIDRDGYLDAKVCEATAHLRRLSAQDLRVIHKGRVERANQTLQDGS